jgi:ubiquinone/menaquinone biosynthesis C-methylase UbiE
VTHQSELRESYAQADSEDAYDRRWGYANPVAAEYWGMRDELMFDAIRRRFGEQIGDIRVLEVGTGHGHELAKLRRVGVSWQQLTGIDLLEARLERARKNYPAIAFHVADAVALPFPDATFDLVMQFTCVMHAATYHVQHSMCAEMIRVLRPDGILLWWDLAPPKWRTLCLRRFLLAVTGSSTLRESMRYGWQILLELGSPSVRQQSLQECYALKAHLVDVGDLVRLFGDLKLKAVRAGTDFEVWRCIWPISPYLARLLWRSGYFSGHSFAIAQKS